MQENETTSDEWWNDAEEVLAPGLPLTSLGASGELVSFVPPPPRPSLFILEELGSEAFSATCDLCDWAWRDQVAANLLPTAALGGELGWVLTLAAVALLSAVIGAAVMVTVMHCRNRLKGIGNSGCCVPGTEEDHCGVANSQSPPTPELHRDDTSKTPPLPESRRPSCRRGGGFWSNLLWNRHNRGSSLGRCGETANSMQRRAPRRLCPPAPPASENHYTVTEPALVSPSPAPAVTPAVEEALYAELHERESNAGGYQNTSYLQESEPDLPSAPSSAYYSDLSCGGGAVYEAVQGEEGTPPRWSHDLQELYRQQQQPYNDLVLNTVACRIATITKTVPSDYV